ncbi:tetratricopeptide repeat protein [Mariprofundus erugo]|uniref:Tetratricopeptide repeat protein n=1 Tax=Mariprofundus erugo TaxID=2528639 RepID=A0A5R9GU91_9PROT|nr:sulfotransferase [Mariprofundus erugo]TLS69108.1 tetratricopeptide repeat protein [Mariprofundus erugo]
MAVVTPIADKKEQKLHEMVEQATRAFAEGQFDVCERLCVDIEALQPGHPDVANILAIVSAQSGQLVYAEQLFVKAINAAPQRADLHANLARLYLRQRLYSDALERFNSALALNPQAVLDVQLGYCAALSGLGDHDRALSLLQELQAQYADDLNVVMARYSALHQAQRLDEAKSCLEHVIAAAPGYFDARIQMAQLLLQQGAGSSAESVLREALSLNPGDIRAWAMLAGLKTFTCDDDADKLAIEALYNQCPEDAPERIPLCFALGKANEELQQFEKAFAFTREGNALRQRMSGYHADAEIAHLQAVTAFYTPEVLGGSSGLEDQRPLFIVGLPHCGSTLVEQILAVHPDAGGSGAANGFEQSMFEQRPPNQRLTFEDIATFSSQQWQEVGHSYLAKLDAGDAVRVVDNTLANFRLVGAIHCALPHARMIHVRRQPLDHCLSIYKHNLEAGQLDFACDLEQLGHYYRHYQQVMQHWREVLPAGVMYEVDYEKLLAAPEDEARKLLAACGLEWSDAVLPVIRAIRADAVVSAAQYATQLQPLAAILAAAA